MDATALATLLGLFSAFTLAAANISVKMGADILVGRAILSVSSAVMVAPAAFFVPLPDGPTWVALAMTLPAHFLYQMCLVQAMRRGDLSLVFPVMRGAAPLLTAFVALALLHERLSLTAWCGLLIASAAVIVFARPPRGTALRAHPHGAALIWAAATAIGISLYNVLDARGVRIAPNPFSFIVWLFLLDALPITAAALLRRRNLLAGTVIARWRYGVAAGALSIASFGTALYAFRLMETAKVSALRETSVVFAALMGSYFLGEGLGARRTAAALALAAGLIVMQFGG